MINTLAPMRCCEVETGEMGQLGGRAVAGPKKQVPVLARPTSHDLSGKSTALPQAEYTSPVPMFEMIPTARWRIEEADRLPDSPMPRLSRAY